MRRGIQIIRLTCLEVHRDIKIRKNNNLAFDRNDKTTFTPIEKTCGLSKDVHNCSEVTCCCGKVCNGLQGLKMNRCSCRVIKGLEMETFEPQDTSQSYEDTGQS